ncbi:hypothetical protein CIG75_19000 [Tumebacillus algifaecis]|uniref:DNA-packaging protein n=1 Tax=Tumebacillus algifaecis TaxID=1214604 RepID=A0A223D5F4_9BACL|nr:phage head-tail connector protein [Tumebacillus algifaecis]ASS76822.1 hypothetical protein CIG75_19000 [Tumebacillus algifaecis]
MSVQKSDVRDLAKLRLGLTDNTFDNLIDMYIDEVEQRILNYINARAVPDGLKFTWAAMVAGALSKEQSNVMYPAGEEEFEIKIGDTSVKPIKPAGSAPTAKVVIDSILFDHTSELNAYRKLRW